MPTLIHSIVGLPDWLRAMQAAIRAQQAFVLITLVNTQGSVPRDAGARMLATAQGCSGTIGGGRLEWQANQRAQSLLAQQQAITSLDVFTLGPELDQCCGGVASVHYEYFPLAEPAWFETLMERWQQGLSTSLKSYPQIWPYKGRGRVLLETQTTINAIELVESSNGEFCVTETFASPQSKLVIFGAGHVAQALVHVLLPLDWQITWVDSRADLFPKLTPGQASVLCKTANPVAFATKQILAGSFCLVMTHEHSLDLEVCAALLARADLAYVGLIGSRTKAMRFRRRLHDQGLAPEQVGKLVCPIGVSGIQSKQPTAIAIGVAAQLLQLREEGSRAVSGETLHESE